MNGYLQIDTYSSIESHDSIITYRRLSHYASSRLTEQLCNESSEQLAIDYQKHVRMEVNQISQSREVYITLLILII